MSSAELAREVLAGLSRKDWDRLVEMSHPDVEWWSFFAALGGGAYRGHDGMRDYARDLDESFETVDAVVDDAVGVGDVALLVGHIHYRGRESGVETASPAGWVLAFRDGKVTYFRAFHDPESVLRSVGVPD